MLRFAFLRDKLRSSLWFLPSLIVLALVLLAVGAAYVDRNYEPARELIPLYGGTAQGARAVLSTVASSMLSLAALVFTITLVVLQLASTKLTPRVMTVFLQQRSSKVALGAFLGTFAYSLVALWLVETPTETADGFIPALMVTLSLILVGASIIIFIEYIHKVAQSIRVENVTAKIAETTLKEIGSIEKKFAEDLQAEAEGAEVLPSSSPMRDITSPRSGILAGLSPDDAVHWAREHQATIEVLVPVGSYVLKGQALVRIWGEADAVEEFPMEDVVSVASERTLELDPPYGLRQLIDIALRALSPGVNEPGTAVIVLDRVEQILHRVGESHIPGPVYKDINGSPRLRVPGLSWAGWVALGLQETIDFGGESTQVAHRLKRLIEDLMRNLPEERQDVLKRFQGQIESLPGLNRPFLQWQDGEQSRVEVGAGGSSRA